MLSDSYLGLYGTMYGIRKGPFFCFSDGYRDILVQEFREAPKKAGMKADNYADLNDLLFSMENLAIS